MQTFSDIFSHVPILTTPRLTLRAAKITDAKDMFEYCRDPQVARYVLWDAHTSIFSTRGYIRFLLRQYREAAAPTFVIEWNDTHKVIGTVGFVWLQPEHRSAEVGYSLNREYWNRGIMTEALLAFLDYAFTHVRLNRVEAEHDVANPASGRVMEKAGMKMEGILHQRIYNKGHYADVALYAMLYEDYRRMKEARS